jgi:flagellar export protein FliJ
MRGEMSAQSVVGANVYIERLKEQEEAQKTAIEGQRGVVRQRQDDVDGARQDLVLATQEVKALEKHREKWEEEVKKERQMREENRMDEIAQAIHRARNGS